MTAANDPKAEFLASSSIAAWQDLRKSAMEPNGQDPLTHVLGAIRLTGALFFVVEATSPWCVDVPKAAAYARLILPRRQHVLSFHVIVEGTGWARVPGIAPTRFEAGDILVFPHGDPYVMESAPNTPPEFTPDQTLEFFADLAAGRLPFVIPEGGGEPPGAGFICGFLGCETHPFNPVLASLPRMVRLTRPDRSSDLLDRLIAMTLEEAQAGRAGGGNVSVRLSELMFIELIRCYAAMSGAEPRGWLAGLRDARIGRALAALHENPAENWTVAALADAAGLSRSALAERFTSLVGHPPARYLALWRMQLATGLLADGTLAVSEVGRRVGYTSEAAFSRSFKKLVGVSPDVWRRAGREVQRDAAPI